MRTALRHCHFHLAARMLATLAVLLLPLLPGGQPPPDAAGQPRQLAAGAPLGADPAVLRARDRAPAPPILSDRPEPVSQAGRALGGKVLLAAAALAVVTAGRQAHKGRGQVPRRTSRVQLLEVIDDAATSHASGGRCRAGAAAT